MCYSHEVKFAKMEWILACVVLLLAVLVMYPRLFFPGEVIFDEHYFVDTVRALVQHGEYRYLEQYTTHPPHGTIATALAVQLLGDAPIGWRMVPFCSHIVILMLIMWLGQMLTRSLLVGVIGALLFSLDGIAFGQATTLFFNAPMLAFLLGSLIAALYASRDDLRGHSWWLLGVAGVSQGIAGGFRWPAFFFVGAILPLLAVTMWRKHKAASLFGRLGIYGCGVLFGYLVPMLLLGIWGAWGSFSLYDFHHDTFLAVYNLQCNHRYRSFWWTWPLLLRPVWYYFAPPTGYQLEPTVRGVVSLGNPALFAMVPAAILLSVIGWVRKEGRETVILLVAALVMWLPWGLVNANTYIHYFYPTLPFTALLVSKQIVAGLTSPRWLLRLFAGATVIAVIAMFVIFYPVYQGAQITVAHWKSLMWLSSWI
jgi:dolichyl-phosphate-mannose-protein mannosyltransferase